jgi:hypothetical protein
MAAEVSCNLGSERIVWERGTSASTQACMRSFNGAAGQIMHCALSVRSCDAPLGMGGAFLLLSNACDSVVTPSYCNSHLSKDGPLSLPRGEELQVFGWACSATTICQKGRK